MIRSVFRGSGAVAAAALLALVLASAAAGGCATGGGGGYERQVTMEDYQRAFDEGKQLGENLATMINAFRRN